MLAVGLNDYADAELKLSYAVPDAKALAEALGEAGKGLYEDVEVTLVQDAAVNRERLAASFTALAGKVRPTDVFAFFIAGHGKTVDGRYYFIPRDFRRAGERITQRDVQAQGIAQEEWQAWFAGIPARKSMLIFDTCESGTLTGASPRDRASARGAANDRLAQATGRSILTASSGAPTRSKATADMASSPTTCWRRWSAPTATATAPSRWRSLRLMCTPL